MIHGIDAPFLLLRQLRRVIHHAPVFCRGAARHIVPETVGVVCAAGGFLMDGIIPHSGFFLCLLRRFFPRHRLIAIGGVFLHGHARCCGLLRDFFLHMGFVVLQLLVKIGKLRRVRQFIVAAVQLFPAGVHMG